MNMTEINAANQRAIPATKYKKGISDIIPDVTGISFQATAKGCSGKNV